MAAAFATAAGTPLPSAAHALTLTAASPPPPFLAAVAAPPLLGQAPAQAPAGGDGAHAAPSTALACGAAIGLALAAGASAQRRHRAAAGRSGKAACRVSIGDKVLWSGKHVGTVRYLGATGFAEGEWAGVELDESAGKHNGTLLGVSYFKCAPQHGVFCLPSQLTSAATQASPAGGAAPPPQPAAQPAPAAPVGAPESSTVSVGQRVVWSGKEPGTVRFVGKTHFASGEWVGVELDGAHGKHDGAFMGVSYFKCAPQHGIFCSAGQLMAAASAGEAADKEHKEEEEEAAEAAAAAAAPPPVEVLQPAAEQQQASEAAPPREGCNLSVGQRVLWKDKHAGTVRYVGDTMFARGEWVGVELDAPSGTHDGTILGFSYFQCPPQHGIFAVPAQLRADPSAAGAAPAQQPPPPTSVARAKKGGLPRAKSALATAAGDFSLGQRVLWSGKHEGTVRFIGQTGFAPGEWLGVELASAQGKHDGTFMGVAYFSCAPQHGIFAQANLLRPVATPLPFSLPKVPIGAAIKTAQSQVHEKVRGMRSKFGRSLARARDALVHAVRVEPPWHSIKEARVSAAELARQGRRARDGVRAAVRGAVGALQSAAREGGEALQLGTFKGAVDLFLSVLQVALLLLPLPHLRGPGRLFLAAVAAFSAAALLLKRSATCRAAWARLVATVPIPIPLRGGAADADAAPGPRGAAPGPGSKVSVGDRVVWSGKHEGVVRFTGSTKFADGDWVGVELDEPVGQHDGTLLGVSYFKCAPKHGVFCLPAKLMPGARSMAFA